MVALMFRHAAADLFLDTLIYGAHSTATDALRGVSHHYLALSPRYLFPVLLRVYPS